MEEKLTKWHAPNTDDRAAHEIYEALNLPSDIVLSNIGWTYDRRWMVTVIRCKDFWRMSKSGVTVGGLWGTGLANDLLVATQAAIENLTEVENQRMEMLDTNAERAAERKAALAGIDADILGSIEI